MADRSCFFDRAVAEGIITTNGLGIIFYHI